METNVLIDSIWIVICALLVFIMQAGFLCLETGLTRSKNNINVAAKNLVDFFVGTAIFYSVGFGLMYGKSFVGLLGTNSFLPQFADLPSHAFFFFQLMFATTAITIISGAIAERMRFNAYMLISVFVALLIYPLMGHWVWAGIDTGETLGWLGRLGFVDFAGGTVVHALGGWVALALLLVIGPRSGRYSEDGTINQIEGANLPLASLGVLLLLFGWFGFNGGSLFALNNQVMSVIINTILGACGGLLTVFLYSVIFKVDFSVYFIINGILVGLVAVTPGAHAISPASSILIGSVGSVVMLASTFALDRFRIDDAVGAIPVHLVGGIWGTLAVGIFGNSALLGTGLPILNQIGVQALGIAVGGAWAFIPTYLLFSLINRFYDLRVSADEENIGLNISEHGASTELLSFLSLLDFQSKSGDTSLRATVEPFTEVGQIAEGYNGVLDRLEDKQTQLSTVLSNAPLALFSADIFGKITLIEGRFFQQMGVNIGQSLYTIFDDENSKQNWLNVYEGQHRDWVASLGDRFIYCRCQPVKNSSGKITGLTGVASDITQQKVSDIDREKYIDMLSTSSRISEQITTILDSNELIETILPLLKQKYNLYHAAVLMLDEDKQTLNFAFGSDERARKLKEKRESISVDHPNSVIARAARRKRVITINDVQSLPNFLPHPLLTETKSELAIPLMIHNQLIGVLDIQEDKIDRFEDSDVDLFTSIARQVAVGINNAQLFEKFEKSEAQLKTALQRAVESDKTKDEFLARVSHELRTPLGVILGYAEMLQDEIYGDVSGEQAERLEDIIDSSKHLTGLVNQLLDSAKIESGKIEPMFKTFELPTLIQTVHQQMDALAKKKKLRFNLSVAEELPKDVYSDPTLIQQMLINLIGNAIKFTEKGMISLEVIPRGSAHFSLIIKDTGIGIPIHAQKDVFEPFRQVDGSKTRRHNGTGLGLAITKRMAEILGGNISLISIEGRGSQFTITLPLVPMSKPSSGPPTLKNLPKVRDVPEFEKGTELEPIQFGSPIKKV
ncbi:MAG: ammonium transporter [Chloroflexota bacterium]